MKMMMPKTASGWAMWVFFLLTGLGAFGLTSLAGVVGLAPWAALVYAVLALIGM